LLSNGVFTLAVMSQPKNSDAVGYLELLRGNRNFRLLWSGEIVSLLGDWFDLIASAALIASLTQSGAAVGGLFVVRMLAPFLVSPFAGVAADRYNRKQLLIMTDILRGITVLGFLFVRTPEMVWLVYALTAIQMAGSGFFFPTRNAILPDIVSRRELGAANALTSATWSIMLAFGAALGGLFSGVWGIYPAFIIDSLTFFLSAVLIQRMVYEPPLSLNHDKSVGAALRQYVEGLNYLRNHVDTLMITLHKAANGLFVAGAFQVLQVTIAETNFPIGEGGTISLGLIYAVTGIGTGVGPIIARYFTGDRDRPLRWAIIVGYLIAAIGLAITGTVLNFPVVLIGAFLRGVGGGTVWVLSTQLLMQVVPVEVRGRIFSTEFALNTLANAIAAGSVGLLLDRSMTVSSMLLWLAVLTLLPLALWTFWVIYGNREKLKMEEQ
jgi:NRE family putative nickel resistance protein-like MFS transporter